MVREKSSGTKRVVSEMLGPDGGHRIASLGEQLDSSAARVPKLFE
jgi:hypothetical protein